VREFGFELALCAHLEAEERIVSRQLGTSCHGSRVMDVVTVEPGPEFDDRRAITASTIPPQAIESNVGAGTATYWKEAFDCHPDRARDIVDAAVACGFFECERRGGRRYVRQSVRYPDWYGTIRGIENKPDLDRPGDLATQLLTDVKLGLVDEVVLATNSYVTGAHRNRLPDPVGIWRFDPDSGERSVVREPEQLPVSRPGVEITARTSTRTEIEIPTPAQIQRQRRCVAERAYGKGWRTYDLPACSRIDPDEAGLPVCPWKGRLVRPAEECGPQCDGHDPSDRPGLDTERLRAARSAWDPEPAGRKRTQTGLDRYQ